MALRAPHRQHQTLLLRLIFPCTHTLIDLPSLRSHSPLPAVAAPRSIISSGMAGVPKLLYLVVVDEDGENGGGGSFRYTRHVLQNTLQLMGCKARHALKISRRVYEVIRSKISAENSNIDESSIAPSDGWQSLYPKENERKGTDSLHLARAQSAQANLESNRLIQFELYKSQTTAIVTRETFLNIVCDALSEYNYVGPNQRADFILACRIRERKESVIILLCGTSGCGKSTLSALLGSRLGITTVVSTDSIRHMMRSFVDEKQNPLLWASTYHAGECLDPVAVAQAKAKRNAKKLAGNTGLLKEEVSKKASNIHHATQPSDTVNDTELVGKKQMAIEGYKAQSEMVIDSLDRLISAWEDRKESVVVEGVHLSLNFVMGLMKKHSSIIPFMVYIANEGKHMERFAVRAKYMTLDPAKNKYVKYMRNIRAIQEYLCNRADKHLVPKVNNTNVDKSVAAIHATVFSCLRRREAGEDLYDSTTNTVPVVNEEYRKQCAANSMSSKGMFQLIQRQGSSRHMMALLNTDGSVAKAWPIESHNDKGMPVSGDVKTKFPDGPIYGPLQIGKAEPVNLQFGNFGISAWPSDTGGASHNGSIDESRAECTDTGSRYFSSRCSSPRVSEGPAKEVKGEISVSGSEEEADEPADEESNDGQSVTDQEINEEIEGSVDEGSTKSDEEFDDLALQDGVYNGYYSDDEAEPNGLNNLRSDRKLTRLTQGLMTGNGPTKNYRQNLDLFSKITDHISQNPFLADEGNWKGSSPKPKKRLSRSQTISEVGKSGS